ncbi:MAG: hypothetical protein AAF078_05655 [Planctomycetota bacterium]
MWSTVEGAGLPMYPPSVSVGGSSTGYFIGLWLWFTLCMLAWVIVLAMLGIPVYGLQRLTRKMPVGRPGELCMACGYDVHMSTGACPECGEPIPERLGVVATDRVPTRPSGG